jgi:hypothetical protein
MTKQKWQMESEIADEFFAQLPISSAALSSAAPPSAGAMTESVVHSEP